MKRSIHLAITYFLSFVWITNGLFCKVLNLVPRHELIVAQILGTEYAGPLTKAIGAAEIFMAFWILSSIKHRWSAVLQIVTVGIMNVIEYFLAPNLLLFGKLNALFALIFIGLVYYNEFILNKKLMGEKSE